MIWGARTNAEKSLGKVISEVTVASARMDNGSKRSLPTRFGDGLDKKNEERGVSWYDK